MRTISRDNVLTSFLAILSKINDLDDVRAVEDHLDEYQRSLAELTKLLMVSDKRGGFFGVTNERDIQKAAEALRIVGPENFTTAMVLHPIYGNSVIMWISKEEDMISVKMAMDRAPNPA